MDRKATFVNMKTHEIRIVGETRHNEAHGPVRTFFSLPNSVATFVITAVLFIVLGVMEASRAIVTIACGLTMLAAAVMIITFIVAIVPRKER